MTAARSWSSFTNLNNEKEPMCHFEVDKSNASVSLMSSLVGGESHVEDPSSKKKLIMGLALFSTYFAVMGAKCALPSTFNQLTSNNSGLNYAHDPKQSISTMLFFSTGAISLGKFLLGPIIDKVGGVTCLKLAITLLMGALGSIASTQSFWVFAVSWVFVDFIFSSCWGACLNAIHSTFQEEEWANRIGKNDNFEIKCHSTVRGVCEKVWIHSFFLIFSILPSGLLAVAGRVGNVSSFFMFASVLQWAQQKHGASSWRLVFWISSAIQLIPLFMLQWFENASSAPNMHHADTQNAESQTVARDSPTIKDSLRILKNESQCLPFWMHLISRSCLMIIASFLLFVPSYMANAFGMTEAASARVGALYALGSLLSVSLGAKPFSASSKRSKILSTTVLLGTLLGCSLLNIAHINGAIMLSPLVGSISMFLWGITFSIPFYIPPSMYALKRGGRQSSATIADAFDFVGFMLLAWFNGFVAGRPQEILSSWLIPYQFLTGFSLTALIASIVAIVSE